MHRRRHPYAMPGRGPRAFHNRHGMHRGGPGGPRARRGDVRAAVLALLAEEPKHGYEMIKEIESRTDGVWKPSAGSIYPTLQMLEDEGLITGIEEDGKRRFSLTDEGRKAVEERSETRGTLPWEEVRSGAPPEFAELGRSVHQLRAAITQAFHAADEGQKVRIREQLDETRRAIYGILSEKD